MSSNTNNGNPNPAVRLQDVADRCHVSKSTAGRALRGDVTCSDETRERVRRVAEEIGYSPTVHHVARRLALSKHGQYPINHLIAAVVNKSALIDEYFLRILRGISDTVMQEGFGMMLVFSQSGAFDSLLPIFERGDLDGTIAVDSGLGFESRAKQLRAIPLFGRRPLVMLLDVLSGCSAVVTDDEEGGYRAASHLLELGHRHLLHFCHNTRFWPHRQRLAGYRRACRDYGLDAEAHLHLMSWLAPYEEEAKKRDLLLYLQEHPEITGILAANDLAAIAIHKILAKQGRRVPEDYSLVGYDDTYALPGSGGENTLTTVRLPLRSVGAEGARLVIDMIRTGEREDRLVELEVELVRRGTVAPPRRRKRPASRSTAPGPAAGVRRGPAV